MDPKSMCFNVQLRAPYGCGGGVLYSCITIKKAEIFISKHTPEMLAYIS